MTIEQDIRRLAKRKNRKIPETITFALKIDKDFFEENRFRDIFLLPYTIDPFYHRLFVSLRLEAVNFELLKRRLKGEKVNGT